MKLLKFGAPWCSQCIVQDSEFKKNPVSVEVKIFNVEEDEAMAEKYKIRSIPNIILIEGDKIIKQWVGYTPSSEINNFIKFYEESN